MYPLKDFQERAVGELLRHTYDALATPGTQHILLEAPTGAGKTVMMAAYLERLTDELPLQPGERGDVAFIWFAPNTLHLQSLRSLQALYADSSKLRCTDLSSLGGNPALGPQDLLFVNWSAVDSEGKLWRRDNETNTNLETLVENTHAAGVRIILIIDEAHLSAFTGPQAIKVRKLIGAQVEVSVTATPKERPARVVLVSRREVVAQGMIKKGVRLNMGLDPEKQAGENVHLHLLRSALAQKQALQAAYDAELGPGGVNPLVIIQLPSDKQSMSEEDKSIRELVEGILANEFGITTANGRLAVWLSGERDTDGLERMNGLQDVLIFKQAIAQGWDCPRAAVLVSYRPVRSEGFGIQTVGRILRMPHQRHYDTDALNYGYVFTDIESNRINFVPADADYFSWQKAHRQEDKGWTFEPLPSARIINDRASAGVLSNAFQTHFFTEMERCYGITQLAHKDLFTPQEELDIAAQRDRNREAMEAKFWTFDIDDHQIALAVDVQVDALEVGTVTLRADQQQLFVRTPKQFSDAFDALCMQNITILNRGKSAPVLRRTLIEFAEYYLDMNEYKAYQVFLYPQNRELLTGHIARALERFEVWQTAKGNAARRVEMEAWTIPEERLYSEHYKATAAPNHALVPFYEESKVSGPEVAFKALLERHSEAIAWWYKNGDNGREHFAVPYREGEREDGKLKLFYVDFVVRFRNGKIGLYDTKTRRYDPDAPAKHNALLSYMETENAKGGRQLTGGVVVVEEIGGQTTFRYCRNRISGTDDLTGWDFLNPQDV